MSDRKFNVRLSINNIGPHFDDKKIEFSDEVNSNKAVFFATNGTGKSFISRAFRLLAPEKETEIANDLLTIGKESGKLEFSFKDGDNTKKLTVSIKKENSPDIVNDTGLFFHVFNSDFVEENIKPRNYTPNGEIDGYILGKAQIDLTEEREREEQLKAEIDNVRGEIDATIEKAKGELKEQGVLPSTKEFGLIEKARFRGNEEFSEVLSFEDIITQLENLSKVPEKIDDIQEITLNINSAIFNDIQTVLLTKYPKTEWDEDFVSSLKANRTFIENGLKIAGDSDTCPFCKQSYDSNALKLIHDYKAYLADREAEVLRQIDRCSESISEIISKLKASTLASKTTIADIKTLGQYFPSLNTVGLEIPDTNENVLQVFSSFLEYLNQKSDDLSEVFPTISINIEACKGVVSAVEAIIKHNNELINDVNKIKDNSAAERLTLRRNLCKAQYLKYKTVLSPRFIQFDEKSGLLSALEASIKEKEHKARISKRDKVYDTLTYFLNRFFAGKFTIDKDAFQIQFLGRKVGDNASRILSDGEKSIVAFCFFLASTHLLMEREDDYNRLFFIIDDPISSMDFHFVYAVAQSLRDIKAFFNITKHDRVWVFTHNMEFLSIVTRNYILNQAYVLRPGIIEPLKQQLLMPYESHLKDIVDVANERQSVSHTTANSIRHVLETVCRFEFPSKSIEKYIEENSVLSDDSCIFTLCQDLSHGGIRNEHPYSDDVLITACRVVENYMKSKYKGQIDAIRQSVQ